jgi:hypothetical protein
MMVLLVSLTACIEDSDNPTAVNPISGERPNIEGRWTTACAYDQEKGTGSKVKVKFSGTSFSLGVHYYSDRSCTQLTKKPTSLGTFTYKKELPSSSGLIPHEIDLKFDNRPMSESLIARQNDTLYLKIDFDEAGRPDNIKEAIPFSIDTDPEEIEPVRPDIDGKWKSDCIYLQDDKIGIIGSYEFSKDKFKLTIKGYSDNSCSQFQVKATYPGTTSFGKELTTPSGYTANELDLHFDDGDEWVSLVARQGNTLYLTPSSGSKRPDDIDTSLTYSKQ